MEEINPIDLLDLAKTTALSAGALLMNDFGEPLIVETKDGIDNNLVTKVDRNTEQFIIDSIHKQHPDHAICGEESGENGDSEYIWYIDPLDGTTNFIHGFPIFAVSIGVKHKTQMVAAAVFIPVLNYLFSASKGGGAFLNDKQIHVSKNTSLAKSLGLVGFPPDRLSADFRKAMTEFDKVIRQAQAIRRTGSAATDLCFIAAGKADAFFEFGLNPWDIAAGSLIIEEAGGKITNLDGSPLNLHGRNLIATNGIIHDELLKIINSQGEQK
jgi:myo-inositol-1(or 4)-monophosphatase